MTGLLSWAAFVAGALALLMISAGHVAMIREIRRINRRLALYEAEVDAHLGQHDYLRERVQWLEDRAEGHEVRALGELLSRGAH